MPHVPLKELRDRVGQTKTSVTDMTIEPGKVQEFAAAIKSDNPVYRSETTAQERGLDAVPAPLSFIRSSYFPRYRPEGVGTSLVDVFDLGFDDRYLVHGGHEFEFRRPLYVGDTITGVSELADIYQREGRDENTLTLAVVETAYRKDDDELVFTERATFIETQDPDGSGGLEP
jgi:acyl dehydratase